MALLFALLKSHLANLHALEHLHLGFQGDLAIGEQIEKDAIEQRQHDICLLHRPLVQPTLKV